MVATKWTFNVDRKNCAFQNGFIRVEHLLHRIVVNYFFAMFSFDEVYLAA
jgi:hypothetical protein